MKAFTEIVGLVCPLDRSNVDTDAIIPKQFLKSIKRSGFGPFLFDEWRYMDQGEPGMDCSERPLNTEFVLNQPRYQGAQILLSRENFGCGSSREHAPWAIADYGFRSVIASSFADIFYGNCFNNGILPITLASNVIGDLFEECKTSPGFSLRVNLTTQCVVEPDGKSHNFEISPHRKFSLLNGLDEVDLTLKHANEIKSFERLRDEQFPWLSTSRNST